MSHRDVPGSTRFTDVLTRLANRRSARRAALFPSARRRLARPVALEALEVRSLLTDPGATLGTAQQINLLPNTNFHDNQALGDGGLTDVDLYKFKAIAGENLIATTSDPLMSGVNTYLRLFDSSGAELVSNNDLSMSSILSQVNYLFTQDGDYFLGVSGNPNTSYVPSNGSNATTGSLGTYSLDINLLSQPIATFDSAGFTAVNGNITATDGSQVDVYSILVPNFSGPPEFQVQADPSGTLNPIVDVFNVSRQSQSVTDLDPTQAGFGGVFPGTASNQYLIRVRTPAGYSGKYQLQISLPNSMPTDDHGDTLNTATPLATGGLEDLTVINGNIDATGDVDTFAFTAIVNTTLSVTAQKGIGGFLNTVLEIRDGQGMLLTQNDDAFPMTTDSQVTQFVAAGQTVYLQLRGQAISRGAYVLRIESDSVPNSPAIALPVTLAAGQSLSPPGRVNAPGDTDVFQVTATQAGTLIVTVSASTLTGKSISVLNSSFQTQTTGGGSAPMVTLRLDVAAGDVFYVQISASSQVGAYNLQLELDVGDTIATALPVTLDSANGRFEKTLGGNWDSPTDVDVFRITAPVSGLFTLNSMANGTFQLVNGLGQPISPLVSAGQVVYVRATTANMGSYGLNLRLDEQQALTPDASGLTLVNGVLQSVDDIDIYRYVAAVDGHLNINVSAFFGVDLRLFDEGGMPLGPPAMDRIDIDLMTGQAVFIGVHTFEQGGNYTLATQIGTGLDDFGNTSGTAQPVSLNVQGHLGLSGQIEAAFDVDRFRFTADSNMTLSIDLRAQPGSMLDPLLRIYDSDGKLLLSNDNSFFTSDSHLSIDLLSGQLIYIEASGYSSSLGGYRLDVQGGSASQFDDFGDTIDAATSIMLRPGLNPPLMGRIEEEFDTDVFSFIAPVSGQLLIQQEAAPDSLLDPYLSVYNAAGVLLKQDDNSGPNRSARVVLSVTAGQQLFVQAGGYSTSTGNYAIRLVLNDFSSPPPPIRVNPGRIESPTETISTSLERDVFRIVAGADGLLTIRQQARPGSTLDPTLSIFTTAGVLQGSNDNAGPGLNAAVTIRVVAGQQLLIQASGYGSTTGDYQIDLELNDGVADVDDLTPIALSLAGETLKPGAIEFAGDTDLYQIAIPADIPAGSILQIFMETNGRGLDPVLSVFDSADLSTRQTLAYSDNDGETLNSNASLSVTAGQTLFVQAGGFGGTRGLFRLRFVFQTDDQPSTLTDTGIVALTLGSDRSVTQPGTINYNGDKDVFEYVATEQGQLRIYQRAVTPGFDAFLQVFNGRSTLLARNDDANGLDAEIDLFVEVGDVLLIQAGAFASSTGQYSLRLEQTFVADDDVPDTFDRATPFSLTGSSGTLSATLSTATDVDIFTFVAASSGTLSAQLENLNGQIAVYELVDSPDESSTRVTQLVARNLNGDTATLQVTQGRQYYIRVTGPATGDYQVDLTQTAPSASSQALTDQEFNALVERARERYAETGNLELVLDELVVEYQRLLTQRGGNPGPVLLLVTDPVDFVLSASGQSQQVGYTGADGRSLEVPQAQLSSDGILEVAVIPSASTSYQLQLQGVGNNYQVSARMVNGDSVQSATVTGQSSGSLSKSSSLQLALDFGATSSNASSGLNAGQISAGTSSSSSSSLLSAMTSLLPALISSGVLTSTEPAAGSSAGDTAAADTAAGSSPDANSVLDKVFSLLKRAGKTFLGNRWGGLYSTIFKTADKANADTANADSPAGMVQDLSQLFNLLIQMAPAAEAGPQPTATEEPAAPTDAPPDATPALPTGQESRPDGQAAASPAESDREFAAYNAF